MKTYFKAIFMVFLLTFGVNVYASIYNTRSVYYASGNTEGYIVITANANTRAVIDSIYANSDLSTSLLKIYEGNPTYNVVADYDIGTGSLSLGSDNAPVFVGTSGFSIKIGVTSTAKNSLIVNYHRE